ncbi:hypothetical protein E1301_Tti010240 [Triplophysa tibetana]|uniref:Uncharacterized protein n=1 Tax=Triplophysa tibetana TaxID=1572043 RepID=A0A5A9NYL3_9TELE|nr:hypothetical protein E1301_Tti010240 [Triplophysa tibetana]
MDAGFFYPECRSERKLSALTLKHRAVHSISITVQAERTTCTDERGETAEVSEAGDVAPSERQDHAKTKNINDENGLDGFRRKSKSQLVDKGKILLKIVTCKRIRGCGTDAPIWWKRSGLDVVV